MLTEDILGVDLGGSKMHFLVQHHGEMIQERWPTGEHCTSDVIRDRLFAFMDKLDFRPRAMGMAIPGGTDGERITVTDSLPMTCYTPASYFTRDGIPIRMVGDMHAAILAAAAPYPKEENVAVVMMGTGVACGYRRYDGKGGVSYGGIDLGYIVFDTPEGPRFLNHLASGPALLYYSGMTGPELAQAVASGDEKAVALVKKAGYFTGLALNTVRLTAGAKIIAIGGGASSYDGVFEAIEDAFVKTCLPLYRDGVKVLKPDASTSLVGQGAIVFAQQTFFGEA